MCCPGSGAPCREEGVIILKIKLKRGSASKIPSLNLEYGEIVISEEGKVYVVNKQGVKILINPDAPSSWEDFVRNPVDLDVLSGIGLSM